jgi:ribosomal protein L37AE/L43A
MRRDPCCPFCERYGAELVSQFGSHILTSQWVCRACGSYFEAVREDFDEPAPAPAAQRSSPLK